MTEFFGVRCFLRWMIFVSAQIYVLAAVGNARRSVMTFGYFISRLSGAFIAGSLAFTLIFAAVHAAEDQRKVTVVSFGLFGGQGVFRREATGAADLPAGLPAWTALTYA